MPRPYPAEFRARAIALVRAGKPQKQTPWREVLVVLQLDVELSFLFQIARSLAAQEAVDQCERDSSKHSLAPPDIIYLNHSTEVA